MPPPAQVGLARAETITFKTADGLILHGWFVPSSVGGAATVIVFNGNAGNRSYRADLAGRLAAQGLAVLLFDYRGYGGNDGSPTEEGLALDARAARDYVSAGPDVTAARIVYLANLSVPASPSGWRSNTPLRPSSCVRLSHRLSTWSGPLRVASRSACC